MPKLKSLDGESRFNFMLALIAYLERAGEVSMAEAAEHFNLDEKYLRDVVFSINQLSVEFPGREEIFFFIDADLADEGILSLLQNDLIQDVPRLSSRQAAAIGAGLNYLATMPAFADDAELKALQELMGQGTGRGLAPAIAVSPGSEDEYAETLRKALLAGKRISCEYLNAKGEKTQREIDPLRIDLRSDGTYLRGYCPINEGLRNFKLDRMRLVEITDKPICDQAKSISEIEDSLYVAQASDIEVTVELEPEAYGLISEFQTVDEPTSIGNGSIRAVIKVGHLPNIAKLISRYRGKARVIEPIEARELVKNYALRVLGESAEVALAEVE